MYVPLLGQRVNYLCHLSWSFCGISEIRCEVIAQLDDIGAIVDHHCWYFLSQFQSIEIQASFDQPHNISDDLNVIHYQLVEHKEFQNKSFEPF